MSGFLHDNQDIDPFLSRLPAVLCLKDNLKILPYFINNLRLN